MANMQTGGTAMIAEVSCRDIRFPTARSGVGADAMHADADYSAAYVTLRTSTGEVGYGLSFTLGRGTGLCVDAARAIGSHLVGMPVDSLDGQDIGRIYRALTSDSQLRWLGPEKGLVHLALSAVLNAVWDLAARRAGVPLWRFLVEMPAEDLVAACDFRYLSDFLTAGQAVEMLEASQDARADRIAELQRSGLPAYTTSPGWLGYSDEQLAQLCREAISDGFDHVKLKVGANVDDDIRRCAIAREVIGPDRALMIDANQVWDVPQAIDWVRRLAFSRPTWIEEPTSPDDVLGHRAVRQAVAPIGVATGEHAHNRVMFKQLLQAESIDYCQIDSCRLASINEIVPVLLMAAKVGVPVCPHAGGVGLCEYVQHLAAFDAVAITGTDSFRLIEFVDHLHEHFIDPVQVEAGAYRLPATPGYSAEIYEKSLAMFEYPSGTYWAPQLVTGEVDV